MEKQRLSDGKTALKDVNSGSTSAASNAPPAEVTAKSDVTDTDPIYNNDKKGEDEDIEMDEIELDDETKQEAEKLLSQLRVDINDPSIVHRYELAYYRHEDTANRSLSTPSTTSSSIHNNKLQSNGYDQNIDNRHSNNENNNVDFRLTTLEAHALTHYPWKIQYVDETHHQNDDANDIAASNDITNENRREDTPQIQHSSTAKIKPPSKVQQSSSLSSESSSIHFPNIHYLQLRHAQNHNWAEERLQKGVEYAKLALQQQQQSSLSKQTNKQHHHTTSRISSSTYNQLIQKAEKCYKDGLEMIPHHVGLLTAYGALCANDDERLDTAKSLLLQAIKEQDRQEGQEQQKDQQEKKGYSVHVGNAKVYLQTVETKMEINARQTAERYKVSSSSSMTLSQRADKALQDALMEKALMMDTSLGSFATAAGSTATTAASNTTMNEDNTAVDNVKISTKHVISSSSTANKMKKKDKTTTTNSSKPIQSTSTSNGVKKNDNHGNDSSSSVSSSSSSSIMIDSDTTSDNSIENYDKDYEHDKERKRRRRKRRKDQDRRKKKKRKSRSRRRRSRTTSQDSDDHDQDEESKHAYDDDEGKERTEEANSSSRRKRSSRSTSTRGRSTSRRRKRRRQKYEKSKKSSRRKRKRNVDSDSSSESDDGENDSNLPMSSLPTGQEVKKDDNDDIYLNTQKKGECVSFSYLNNIYIL